MIVRTIDEIRGSDREIHAENWVSRRLLLKGDGMGFSFHETIIRAGTVTHMWYKNHLEAVYCVEGEGEIEERDNGARHKIEPGMVYALDQHDRHTVRAQSDLRLLCVFNPPCTGAENHDADGSYPLVEDAATKG
jgi:L-ectoine synthase